MDSFSSRGVKGLRQLGHVYFFAELLAQHFPGSHLSSSFISLAATTSGGGREQAREPRSRRRSRVKSKSGEGEGAGAGATTANLPAGGEEGRRRRRRANDDR